MPFLTRWLSEFRFFRKAADLRDSARQTYVTPIEVRTTVGALVRGSARDLSECGMSAIIYGELTVGETVLVKYDHPGAARARTVARQAVVQRKYGQRYSFRFGAPLPIA